MSRTPQAKRGRPEVAAAPKFRLGGNYWRLFGSSLATNLGDGIMSIAMVWLASGLTRDPLLISVVALASRLPWLLFTLPAGVLADRLDRRHLVAWTDVARATLVAAFALAVWRFQGDLHTPEQLASGVQAAPNAQLLLGVLIGVSFGLGCAEVVRDNAAQTLMASVVEPYQLERANGRLWGAETTMNVFVGPPLGGLLVAFAVALPFGLNAALLATAALLVFSLVGSFKARGADESTSTGWRAEAAEGFRWLWGHRLLRTLALMLAALNLLSALSTTLLVLFAQEILGLYEGVWFGAVTTGVAAGAVVGSLLAERIATRLGPGAALSLSVAGMAATSGVTSLVSSPIAFWVCGLASGVMVMLWNVITVSLRQRIIPDRLLGRVNSAYRFFGWGFASVGTLLGGVVVATLSPLLGREWALRTPFLAAGVLGLVLLAIAVRTLTTRRIRDAEQGSAAESAVPS